jgi:hypothetical protein
MCNNGTKRTCVTIEQNAYFNQIGFSKECAQNENVLYMGADKSLAPPGRKQATTTEDFDVHISYLLS